MKKQYKIFLTFSFLTLYIIVSGQTKNANDFLRFSKQNFNIRSNELKTNKWELLQPTSIETDNGISTKMSFFGTKISSKEYYIILEVLTNSKSTTKVEKTTIKLPNGTEFDKLVADFEKLGYTFQKMPGENGQLVAGGNGMVIKVGIENIEDPKNDWIYKISIINTIK